MAVALAVKKSSELRGAERAEQDVLPVVLGLTLQIPLSHPHDVSSMQVLGKLVERIKDCISNVPSFSLLWCVL